MTTEERLQKLERELLETRLKCYASIVVLAAVATIVLASWLSASLSQANAQESRPAPSDEVVTHRLTVLDASGKPRALLLGTEDGARLTLHDADGNKRIVLSAGKDETLLSLDPNGSCAFLISVDKNRSSLTMTGDNQQRHARLHTDRIGTRLTLVDGATEAELGAADLPLLGSRLELRDLSGKPRVRLRLDEAGPCLGLDDEKGKTRAVFGVGQTVAVDGKTVTYPESSLLLFNPDGNLRWSAP